MKWLYACIFLTACSNAKIEEIRGPAGPQGIAGPQGPRGDDGTPAQSCTVQPAVNGAVILCPDGTSVLVLNGTNGADGLPAPASFYSINEIIDPCGKQSSFDEVILRLGNGQLMAHYSGDRNNFLTLLSPGDYVTTDGTQCYFNVSNSLGVTW